MTKVAAHRASIAIRVVVVVVVVALVVAGMVRKDRTMLLSATVIGILGTVVAWRLAFRAGSKFGPRRWVLVVTAIVGVIAVSVGAMLVMAHVIMADSPAEGQQTVDDSAAARPVQTAVARLVDAYNTSDIGTIRQSVCGPLRRDLASDSDADLGVSAANAATAHGKGVATEFRSTAVHADTASTEFTLSYRGGTVTAVATRAVTARLARTQDGQWQVCSYGNL